MGFNSGLKGLNVEAKYLIFTAIDIFKVRGFLEWLILRRNIRDQIPKI
jgi:hypothetical protein